MEPRVHDSWWNCVLLQLLNIKNQKEGPGVATGNLSWKPLVTGEWIDLAAYRLLKKVNVGLVVVACSTSAA